VSSFFHHKLKLAVCIVFNKQLWHAVVCAGAGMVRDTSKLRSSFLMTTPLSRFSCEWYPHGKSAGLSRAATVHAEERTQCVKLSVLALPACMGALHACQSMQYCMTMHAGLSFPTTIGILHGDCTQQHSSSWLVGIRAGSFWYQCHSCLLVRALAAQCGGGFAHSRVVLCHGT
jgi:hypothetical protein